MLQTAIFNFIRVQIQYTDKSLDLCMDTIKLTIMKKVGWMILLTATVTLASCEVLDDDIDKHISQPDSTYIQLNEVTEILASLPLTYSQISEVHMAVTSSLSNGGENENGGTPITGIKTALTNFFKKKLKGEAHPDVLRKGLVYVCSVNLKNPIYDGQTKSKITNPELRGLCQRATTQMLETFELRHNDEFKKVLELLTRELKAEAAAENARKKVLEATKEIEKNQKKKMIASDKLKDAEFLGEGSTLLIVEGDSAASSIAKARDYKKYGILAIRGKILNCLAHPDEKIFENEEIKLLLSAMNIVPNKYDSSKLRYGKIGICVDADSDGGHIALLIMAALRYLAPKFLEEGRLCWLRSPLYIVKNGKNTSYYFTDEEFNKVRGKIKGEVSRAKGLGALSQKQAEESMFGEFQRMDKLEADDESIYFLESLMGVDVEPRRKYVFNEIDFSEVRE